MQDVRLLNPMMSYLLVSRLFPSRWPRRLHFDTAQTGTPAADLAGIKTYLTTKAAALARQHRCAQAGEHAVLFPGRGRPVRLSAPLERAPRPGSSDEALNDARAAWLASSPLYEQIEGIVAGVPSLAEYDVILDAGRPRRGERTRCRST